MKYLALTLALAILSISGVRAEGPVRAWETGVWTSVEIVRPKIVFGVSPRNGSGAFAETRTYVIETDDLRLEMKENTTADAPRIDATIGERVTFALEKKTVYIKAADGAERKLNVTKKIIKTPPPRQDRAERPPSLTH